MSQLIPSTTPLREFEGHEEGVNAIAIFPDKRRMVTGSYDHMLRLWDLKTGEVLKKMEGHIKAVLALAVSPDAQLIASGGLGEVIVWRGETGEPLTQPIKAHSSWIYSLDFSPDGTVLATGSGDQTTKLWNTKTWQEQGNSIKCSSYVFCVRYSPSGQLLAISTTTNIQIYNPDTRECVITLKGHTSVNFSLAWTPNGTRLLSGGDNSDPTIREWDASTWQQVDDPWTGHTGSINTITVNPFGTLVASASSDSHVRLWRLPDRQTIAIFKYSSSIACMTFSLDGTHILGGGDDKMISEWAVPMDNLPEDALKELASEDALPQDASENEATDDFQVSDYKILSINTTARIACIAGDLYTAEQLFTQEVDADASNYMSYANRSLIMARNLHWDHALEDAIKSIAIQPSLTGYISKGIALCGKGHIRNARAAFDIASIFANENNTLFLLLIKAIAMFNADQHEEALILLQELAAACPNNDAACRVVEAYLFVQLGINAANDGRHNDAADHFTAAVNSGALSSTLPIHPIYEDFVMLFGWDLKSLWQNAHQKQCDALRQAGRLEDALDSYRHMMDKGDENTKANCLDWSNAFTEECSMLSLASGDAALAARDYDRAIGLYSVVIDLNLASETFFENRSKAKLGKMLWEDAFLDAQKVIQLDPSSHIGYKLKHAALHGAQLYDEAIQSFRTMLSILDNALDAQTRKLRPQYLRPSAAERAIRKVIDAELDNAPLRVIDTTTGRLCNREVQISAFQTSMEYKELVSSTIMHPDLQTHHIKEVVMMYFQYAMLSHRWEGQEPLLQDIQDKVVYELDPVGGIMKLQSFCKTARDAGYRWAWSDTCCIDKSNNVELQESVNSMFVWYHHSALTVVYLSDVPPSSKSGALAKSIWNTRGWTVQEFLAPKVIIFYQKDWTLYLNDRTPNHKESVTIMQELEDATSIDRRAIVAFRPGMRGAREKLQWASTRVTTLQEDIAYSLSGIFGVRLRVDYGEKKQNALGRLLQEIIAQSGDITALDWAGESSEFNSCLPADITSYEAPPCKLPSLSEDEIQSLVSSLRGVVALDSASKLYQALDSLSAPRFAHRRLHLPCIVFPVTEARRRPRPNQDTYMYAVKSDGLHDLQITTTNKLTPFSLARPLPTWQTILLVRPWSRHLLELHDRADDAQSVEDWSVPESLLHDSPRAQNELVYLDSHSRALRLIVRLGQPFGAFLLARQRDGEFKRIASDHDIIVQVKDTASINEMIDIRILEVL